MTNTKMLEEKIADVGISKKRIAEKLGITPQALRLKIIGDCEFTGSEIGKLIDILRLTEDELHAIFFTREGE